MLADTSPIVDNVNSGLRRGRENLRVTHGENEGMAAVSWPHAVELCCIPNFFEEELWDLYRVCIWALSVCPIGYMTLNKMY